MLGLKNTFLSIQTNVNAVRCAKRRARSCGDKPAPTKDAGTRPRSGLLEHLSNLNKLLEQSVSSAFEEPEEIEERQARYEAFPTRRSQRHADACDPSQRWVSPAATPSPPPPPQRCLPQPAPLGQHMLQVAQGGIMPVKLSKDLLEGQSALAKHGPVLSNGSLSTMVGTEDWETRSRTESLASQPAPMKRNGYPAGGWLNWSLDRSIRLAFEENDEIDAWPTGCPTHPSSRQQWPESRPPRGMQSQSAFPSERSSQPKTVVSLADECVRTAPAECGAITTVMIRNIPNRCSQRQLINELNSLGLTGKFDFLYVPLDLETMSNAGYAFVNFVDSSWAAKCMELLPNHRFKRQRQAKVVAVSKAHVQGLENNIRHCEKQAASTAAMGQRRPVILSTAASQDAAITEQGGS